jgi:hypothetical protein
MSKADNGLEAIIKEINASGFSTEFTRTIEKYLCTLKTLKEKLEILCEDWEGLSEFNGMIQMRQAAYEVRSILYGTQRE